MNDKNQKLQQEIDSTLEEIAKLETRREAMQAESDEINSRLQTRAAEITDALVEGRDVTKLSDAQNRDRDRLVILADAIGAAGKRIEPLQTKHDALHRALLEDQCESITQEAISLLGDALARLDDTANIFEALEKKFQAVDILTERRVAYIPERVLRIKNAFRFLRGNPDDVRSIPGRLQRFGVSFSDVQGEIVNGRKP